MKIIKADVERASKWKLPDGHRLPSSKFDALGISSGDPILLDENFRPSGLLAEYIRERNLDLEPETAFQYAYELRRFGDYLESRGTSFETATSRDLRRYRKHRTEKQASPLGPAAWKRNASAIRGLMNWMQENGIRADNPGASQFRRSALSGKPVPDEKIRSLTREQWTAFLQYGIRGYAIDEHAPPNRQGQNVGRLYLGAGIALTSGMRLQEFSTLLLPEVEGTNPDVPKAVHLQACAKFGKSRTVYLTPTVLRQATLYCQTERVYYAERRRKYYESHYRDYFVVEAFDKGYAVGSDRGISSRILLEAADPPMRARMIFNGSSGLEPLALFLSRTGALLQPRSWLTDFRQASKRASGARLANGAPAFFKGVKPHDLRHTFAVQILRQLMHDVREKGLQHSSNMHEHLVLNPVLTVQRLLGHSQPSTTLKYLRYIETLDDPLIDAWEGWEDPSFTFEDYGQMLLKREQDHA